MWNILLCILMPGLYRSYICRSNLANCKFTSTMQAIAANTCTSKQHSLFFEWIKSFFFKSHGFIKNESQLFSESAEDERERKLQKRRERDRARCARRTKRLAKRRVRDRAGRAAQTAEQRQACLQCRRGRLMLSQLKKERPGYSRCERD